MTIILAADAPWSGAALAPEHKPRVGNAERAMVPEGVVSGERARAAKERRRDRKPSDGTVPPVDEISERESATFMASVIAAGLPPAPAETAIQRIWESETAPPLPHLRDRLV